MKHQLDKNELRLKKTSRHEFHKLPRNQIYLLLDNLKCSHNVGTILRLSDALLVQKVFLCGDTINPMGKKMRQGSRGSERWVDFEQRNNSVEVIRELKGQGIFIVSAELADGSVDYRNIDITLPVCFVMGREDKGVNEEVLGLSDAIVSLPIYGMTNSLNVATVAAVLLYEMVRRFDLRKPADNRQMGNGFGVSEWQE